MSIFRKKSALQQPQKKKKTKAEKLQTRLDRREAVRQVIVKHKLKKKTHRAEEALLKSAIQEKFCFFNFFTKWFFLGIILILLGVCITLCAHTSTLSAKPILQTILTIFSSLFSTVGIALFIGCIFDFSKNSDAFISFVSKILSDIVVSKTFLSTLSVRDKEQALNLILKPMDAQVEQYANINAFFKKKIKESMTMFDANFKTNVNLSIEAHVDESKNHVYCETTLTYTIYKLNNKFDDIMVTFEKRGSYSSSVKIICPTGSKDIPVGDPIPRKEGEPDYETYVFKIPEEYEKYDHLTVKRVMTEPGSENWINYYWQTVTPYENLTCRLTCFDGLTIKDFMIFDNKAFYHVNKSDDGKRLDITSSEWLDSDTGFCIHISK